jgi:hypothetical protein
LRQISILNNETEDRLWLEAYDLILSWGQYNVTDSENLDRVAESVTGAMPFFDGESITLSSHVPGYSQDGPDPRESGSDGTI